jgi:hypothetical protein
MVRRLVSAALGCVVLGFVLVACGQAPDGPAGVDSCDDLADLYVAVHQQAVDDVELADPAIPDGVDSGEDGERLNRILHVFGGLDWIERTSEIAVRWGELGCEPADATDVLRSRVGDLSYETSVGEYLVETYFGL